MKVAFLADQGNADGTPGGAELTMQGFAGAAPDGIDLKTPLEGADAVVLGNCVSFRADLIRQLAGKRVVRYFNDLDPHSDPTLRRWLLDNAICVFTSPYHQRQFPHEASDAHVIPPPIDLDAFEGNGKREGNVAVGAWQNPGKGQQQLLEWSNDHGPVDVYGFGPFIPHGPHLNVCGGVPSEEVPGILRRYETFVHLPTEPEPFGRAVVEAWAAGCQLVVNRNIGALHFLQDDQEALRTASQDFWSLVCW